MREDNPSEVAPAQLLDDYLRLVRQSSYATLPATAIRTRSLDARLLLARAAFGDAGTLDELLVAARAADRRWLTRRRRNLHTGVLAGLAQVLAMQDILPTDRTDGLAVYDLIRRALGPDALSAGHQGLHAQLAFRWQGRDRAAELLTQYGRITEQIRAELTVDLANPFVEPDGRPVEPWLAGFCALLAEPAVRLTGDATRAPFDRLVAGKVTRIETGPLISVIVTAYRPDDGLITAVRSILAQSWSNLEVLVVDDASPAEFDAVLDRCLGLDPRVRLVRPAVNGGTYRARNAGLDAARGEFVTFQDSDDFSHPRRLELQVQPLLNTEAVVATTADGVSVTDDLLLTRPGVRSGRFNPSSLMLRRIAVRQRIGYFDQVRKAADSEFIGRLRAAFGPTAVHHLDSAPLSLIRLSQNSLSRSEIRAFWMHPGRVAYSSAYLRWHERIAAGTVHPYRPAEPVERPFAAPAHLQRAGGTPAEPARFDVVLATDWTAADGPQQSMLDELAALHRRGLRVGVLQFEAYLPVQRRRRPLNPAVQDLINAAVVTHVQPTDVADVALLMIRCPAALQFASAEPSALRIRRVVVLADQAPNGADGTARRYAPAGVTAVVRRLFGVPPLWCPQDTEVRDALLRHLDASQLSAFDLPGAIDTGRWTATRQAVGARRAVIGRDLRDSVATANAERDALLRAMPRGPRMDVRLRGGPHTPRSILDKVGLPAGWLVYGHDDVDARAFLHQLDFYADFPDDNTVEAFGRATLEALAVGCVVLLPHRFAETYGDAAVYCAPDEVTGVARRYFADPDAYAEQSRRGQRHVARHHTPQAYAELVEGLIDGAPARREPMEVDR
ncbi:MAG TPA: glycosyltransferase [Actinoplanes sp.]|nr:glycosyltransferase [Actinoplanes sp.]